METVLAGKINGFQKILCKRHLEIVSYPLEVPVDSQGEDRGYWKLHGIFSEIYSTRYIYTIELMNMVQIISFF